jgi:hypothetical protein
MRATVVAAVEAHLLLVPMEQLPQAAMAAMELHQPSLDRPLPMLAVAVVVETPHLVRLAQVALAAAAMEQIPQSVQTELLIPAAVAAVAVMQRHLIGAAAQAAPASSCFATKFPSRPSFRRSPLPAHSLRRAASARLSTLWWLVVVVVVAILVCLQAVAAVVRVDSVQGQGYL